MATKRVKDEETLARGTQSQDNVVTSQSTSNNNTSPQNYSAITTQAQTTQSAPIQQQIDYDAVFNEVLSNYQAAPSYSSPYQAQIDSILNKLNTRTFDYNASTDPTFQQHKDLYTQQGRTAMRDVAGNAASLTGGYGNSYATTAASQANDTYMSAITDKATELRGMALNEYNSETSNLQTSLSGYQTAEDMAYNAYLNELNQWNSDRNVALDIASQKTGWLRDDDLNNWNRYVDSTNIDQSQQQINQNQQQINNQVDQYWNNYNRDVLESDRSYEENVRQFDESMNWDRESYSTDLAWQQALEATRQSEWQQEYNQSNSQYASDNAYRYYALNNRASSNSSSTTDDDEELLMLGDTQTPTSGLTGNTDTEQLENNMGYTAQQIDTISQVLREMDTPEEMAAYLEKTAKTQSEFIALLEYFDLIEEPVPRAAGMNASIM